jgi:hypothetical protein
MIARVQLKKYMGVSPRGFVPDELIGGKPPVTLIDFDFCPNGKTWTTSLHQSCKLIQAISYKY